MAETLKRRELVFTEMDQIIEDVQRLVQNGYDQAGNWDLAQICGHLADWLRFPIEGFPFKPLPWMLRITIGRWMKKKILRTKQFPDRQRTMTETIPAAGGDAAKAVAQLVEAVRKWKNHMGEFKPSPLFGAMSRDECTQIQMIHCAHHLRHLVPKGK